MENLSELTPLKERFEVIAQSGEQYPIDFDEAWQWVGYTRKDNALKVLIDNFEEQQDFSLILRKSTGGRPLQDYFLTTDCFKSFCMMAGTERGKDVRKYYLAVEKAFVAVAKVGGGLTAAQAEQLAMLPEIVRLMGETRRDLEDPKAKAYRELEAFVADNLELNKSNAVRVYAGMLHYIYKKNAKHPLSEREFMLKIALDHPEFELKCHKKAWFFDGCGTKRGGQGDRG